MNRLTIILIVVGASAAWMLYKRYVKKEPWGSRARYSPPQPAVENWYRDTAQKIADMDEIIRDQRESEWKAKSNVEQMEFSDKFMVVKFSEAAVNGYTRKQRLKIGMAHFVAGSQSE
jgi:hypothetical protein